MKQPESTNYIYMYLELVLGKKKQNPALDTHLRHSVVGTWICPDINLRGPDLHFGNKADDQPTTRER